MFKLPNPDKPLVVDWPVHIPVPLDGGGVARHKIAIRYRILPQSRLDELQKAELLADVKDGIAPLLHEVVAGWRHVQDEAGNELDFSPAALDRLLDISSARVALLAAFYECAGGRKAKN